MTDLIPFGDIPIPAWNFVKDIVLFFSAPLSTPLLSLASKAKSLQAGSLGHSRDGLPTGGSALDLWSIVQGFFSSIGHSQGHNLGTAHFFVSDTCEITTGENLKVKTFQFPPLQSLIFEVIFHVK